MVKRANQVDINRERMAEKLNDGTLLEKEVKKASKSTRFPLTIDERDKMLLMEYFEKRDVSLASGIRNILSEWMIDKGLK